MRTYSFASGGADDFLDAFNRYQAHSVHSAPRFLVAVESSLQQALEHPKSGISMGALSRRIRVSRYPYSLVYRETTRGIRVLAMPHGHREDQSARGRR